MEESSLTACAAGPALLFEGYPSSPNEDVSMSQIRIVLADPEQIKSRNFESSYFRT